MVAKILDQFGNPIQREVLSEPQTSRVAWLNRLFAEHPSRGLTPAKLGTILDAAELGDMMAQCDLFEDMEEKDGHIFAELSKRKRVLNTLDWDIQAPPNASTQEKKDAEYIKEVIQDLPDFEDIVFDMMDGCGKAFSCLENEWHLVEKEWRLKAVHYRPQSWFMLDRETRTQIKLRDMSVDGVALQPFGWIVHTHKAKSGYLSRAGLHRVLVWPFLFKNYSVRDMAEFLEIYGLPLRLGKYPEGSSDDEKATLLRAVMSIGHDAAGIIPEGMSIEFQKAAEGASMPFDAMTAWCERTQSKAILGGTLTAQADGKSSTHALGNIHNEVRHDLKVSDAKQIASTIRRDIIYPHLALNRGGVTDMRRLPRFMFDTREPRDITAFAAALPNLVNAGMQIPRRYPNEILCIPVPQDGEPVLTLAKPQNADIPISANRESVAAATTQNEPADEIDMLADEMNGDWERVTSPVIEPILSLAAECQDYAEFNHRLPEVIGKLDPATLTELLAQGQFVANVWGRVNGSDRA